MKIITGFGAFRILSRHLILASAVLLGGISAAYPVFAQNISPAPHEKSTEVSQQTINLNTADAPAIVAAHIKGIGKKRAEAIVAYRTQHGPFKSVDDLRNIKGISENIINTNRERLLLK